MDLLRYMQARWRVFALCCGVAGSLALVVSLMLPKQYTATAQVLIEPPGGNDPRVAAAISPTYLESLKAYERMASSDTVFVRALEHVHPHEAGAHGPVEALRRKALRVSKPTGTAVLEIVMTLTDPRDAQAMAQFIAEETVRVNNSLDSRTQTETMVTLRARADASLARVSEARKEMNSASLKEPVDALDREVQNLSDLKLKIDTGLAQARAAADQAQVAALEKQSTALAAEIASKESRLADWKGRKVNLEANRDEAQFAWKADATRLNDMMTSMQFRGERLHVIDAGIVPQSPTSPSVPLNVIAAVVLAAAGSFIYLAAMFSFARVSTREMERVYRLEH